MDEVLNVETQPEQPGPPPALCAFIAQRLRTGLAEGRIVRRPDGRLVPAEYLTNVLQWEQELSAIVLEEVHATA